MKVELNIHLVNYALERKDNMIKKILKITMVLSVLLLMLIPLSVNAATYGDLTYYINMPQKEVTIGGCSSSVTSLTNIPSQINGYPVTEIMGFAFDEHPNLTTIIIPNNIKTIKGSAFKNCTKLTNVTIPNSITEMGISVFYGCTSLTHIEIPNSLTTIPASTFRYCSNLKSITLPNTITLIDMYAISECSNLETIYFKGTQEEWENVSIDSSNSFDMIGVDVEFSKIKIIYNANNGINPPNSHIVNSNSNNIISSKKPSRTGYEFLGWSTSSIATAATYQPNDTITVGKDNITLYAVWKEKASTKTQVLNGIFLVTPTNVENGNRVIFACYNNDKMVYVNPYIYAGETTIPFTTTENYDKVKVMVWESLETCVPLCEAEDVPLN